MRVSLKVYVPAIILRVCCYKEIFHNFTHCFDTYPKLLFYSIDNIKFATLKGVFIMDPRDYEREQERKRRIRKSPATATISISLRHHLSLQEDAYFQ